MNRAAWKFPYSADRLFEAAGAKKTFHEGRLDWWSTKRQEVEGTIRSEGIEIDESVAVGLGTSYSNGLGRGANVSIRNDLVRDLQECVGKTTEHRTKIQEYDAWMQVLDSQGKSTFELNQDDWLFFFGK